MQVRVNCKILVVYEHEMRIYDDSKNSDIQPFFIIQGSSVVDSHLSSETVYKSTLVYISLTSYKLVVWLQLLFNTGGFTSSHISMYAQKNILFIRFCLLTEKA